MDQTAPPHDQPVPPVIRRATTALFTALARVRDARAFHPRGVTFAGALTLVGRGVRLPGVEAGPALVRLSKGAGLPDGVPDVLGLAVRLPDALGPGRPQDLLLSTAGTAPVARHLLRPTRGVDRRTFSSLLPYRVEGGARVVGARWAGPPRAEPLRIADLEAAVDGGEAAFTLVVASPSGEWHPVAHLQLQRRLPADEARRIRFHPWNTAPGLRPAGLLNRLRGPAYAGSQRGATSE
ncbi:phosphodiesterase [Euzebya sp.]|uniref:phosphodiesterase n=1 Tax=Euzebya sp. TaxID=1971409 RepID=UPI0035119239